MKKLTELVIDAGLVPAHTLALMKHWKLVPEEATETELTEEDKKAVWEIVHKLAELLNDDQNMPDVREASLDILQLFDGHHEAVMMLPHSTANSNVDWHWVEVVVDRGGRVVIPYEGANTSFIARPGTRIRRWDGELEVTQVEP